jgi:hypothetical protein
MEAESHQSLVRPLEPDAVSTAEGRNHGVRPFHLSNRVERSSLFQAGSVHRPESFESYEHVERDTGEA